MRLGSLIRPRTAEDWRRVIALLLLGDVVWIGALYLYGRAA